MTLRFHGKEEGDFEFVNGPSIARRGVAAIGLGQSDGGRIAIDPAVSAVGDIGDGEAPECFAAGGDLQRESADGVSGHQHIAGGGDPCELRR